jgi:predicted nucleic acid-binding protein
MCTFRLSYDTIMVTAKAQMIGVIRFIKQHHVPIIYHFVSRELFFPLILIINKHKIKKKQKKQNVSKRNKLNLCAPKRNYSTTITTLS